MDYCLDQSEINKEEYNSCTACLIRKVIDWKKIVKNYVNDKLIMIYDINFRFFEIRVIIFHKLIYLL